VLRITGTRTELWELVRPVCVCLLAIGVVAWAMAIKGWDMTSLELGVMLLGIGTIVVMHIHRVLKGFVHDSALLRKAAIEAERHYTDVLTRIIGHVEGRDRYWTGHSHNVAALSEKIARKLGMPSDHCELVGLAGRLHDIGILAVPPSIRMNRSRLVVEELRSVQKHPEVSYEVLQPLGSIAPVLPAIRWHHERLNGTGYPKGLAGEQIPLEARILAAADAYDAMTHDRPHRPAMTPLQAMLELRRCTPAAFDPRCVDALAEIVNLPDLEMTVAGERANRVAPAIA